MKALSRTTCKYNSYTAGEWRTTRLSATGQKDEDREEAFLQGEQTTKLKIVIFAVLHVSSKKWGEIVTNRRPTSIQIDKPRQELF